LNNLIQTIISRNIILLAGFITSRVFFKTFFNIFAGFLNNNYSPYSDYNNIIPFSQANIFETYYLSASSIDLFSLILYLLLLKFQVIIISKSTARFFTQLLYPWFISSLLSLTLFYTIFLLEPSPTILFLVIPAISKLLLYHKLRYYEKYY
jgi:hypothetical protein